MKLFLHGRVQKLLHLMAGCNDLLKNFIDQDLGVDAALAKFLGAAATGYGNFGRKDVEGKILLLLAELSAVRRGIDPITYQRISSRRRELASAFSLKALQITSRQISSDLEQDENELQAGRALLTPLILAALQRGLIPDPATTAGNTAAIQALWREFLIDQDICLAAKRVALTLSLPDILLLMESMLGDLS